MTGIILSPLSTAVDKMRQNYNEFKLNENNEYINGSNDDNSYVIIVKNCSTNAKNYHLLVIII